MTTGVNFNGVAFDLFKDGQPVVQSLKRGKYRFWIVFILALVVIAAFYLLIKDLL
jgi:cytochrome c-type biogenesis protein CcmE